MTTSTSRTGTGDLVLVDLIEEITKRLRTGEAVDIEAFASGYPEHAELLRELFPALELLAVLPAARRSDMASDSSSPGTTAAGPLSGMVGEYRILGEVGRGGMGIVYEAEQMSLGRRVALKVLPFAAALQPRHLQRFKNEARAAAALDHPNIVSVHAVGCERGVHYYAMQFIEGQTFAEVVDRLRRGEGGEG